MAPGQKDFAVGAQALPRIFTAHPCDIQPCAEPETHSIIAQAKAINSEAVTDQKSSRNSFVFRILTLKSFALRILRGKTR